MTKAYDGEVASTGFAVLRPAVGVEPSYLFSKTISRDFVSALTGEQYGVSYPSVKEDQVKAQPLELPPLNEQRRIVARIEELFSALDKGVESLKTTRVQLKIHRQSVLKHAANGQLLVDKGYRNSIFGETELTKLSEVVRDLGQGWSQRCLNQPTQSEDVWGVIKTTAIQHLLFNDQKINSSLTN